MQPEDGHDSEKMSKRGRTAAVLWIFVAMVIVLGAIYLTYRTLMWTRPWPALGQVPVDLTEDFNNDAMAWKRNPRDGNFDCPDHAAGVPGSSYPADLLPQTGAVFSVEALPRVYFLFPGTQDGFPNNVSCGGQKITVPSVSYEKLFVLGAAENGNQEAEITFQYEDGSERMPLRFTDWCEPAEFGETPAFSFDYRFAYDDAKEEMIEEPVPCHLWIQEIRLNPDKHLQKIVLPYNSRMHIVAMTLIVKFGELGHLKYAQEAARTYADLIHGNVKIFDRLREEQERLERKLVKLCTSDEGRYLRESLWMEARLERCGLWIPAPGKGGSRTIIPKIRDEQLAVDADLQSLLSGKNLFVKARGAILKAFISDVDGTLQPYSVHVPGSYKGDKPFPMVLRLHGHGWYKPFQGHPAPAIPDAIVLSPHGRGSIDYFFIAEDDVLRAIQEVQRDYRIDANRIYLMGSSMGGTGSWHFGTRYPDIFAAIAPTAGNADHKVWEREWRWGWRKKEGIGSFVGEMFGDDEYHPSPNDFDSLREFVADAVDPVTYAENLMDLPAYCIHGAQDEVVPVGHARSMTARLKTLGYDVTYVEVPEAAHGGFPGAEMRKQREWLLKQRRKSKPEVVRYRTNKLRYAGAYWLRINAFSEPVRLAEIEGKSVGEGMIEIRQRNVAHFTISLGKCPLDRKHPIQVKIDGDMVFEDKAPKANQLTFQRGENGTWSRADRASGFRKRKNLEGPIEDAFMSPFLVVYGTTANTELEREITKREADLFVNDWKRMYVHACRMKADTEVTEDDVKTHNLILYGKPNANLLTARVMHDLPIRVTDEEVIFGKDRFRGDDVGVKFCYPNPLNPDRYVVVLAATTWKGIFQINNRFGNWFNWGVYDNRNWFDYGIFDSATVSPETFLVLGFFDQFWRPDEKYKWRGKDAERKSALEQRAPQLRSPSDGMAEFHLSELLPVRVDQHKGPVRFDCSFQGNVLSIAGEKYERGIGMRAPSVVEFDIAGKADRFYAEVGVDLEGATSAPEVRTKNEYIQFRLYGDGRRLYQSQWLQWDSAPEVIDVSVKGVKRLKLDVQGSGARWHFGSAAWGECKLTREPVL